MTQLLNIAITTPISSTTTTTIHFSSNPKSMIVQGNFTWTSGGVNALAYIQTSIDGGTTWSDVVNYTFGAASLRSLFNVSSAATSPQINATDGTLTANTAISFLGPMWRVKYSSTGTYVGTTMTIDIIPSF